MSKRHRGRCVFFMAAMALAGTFAVVAEPGNTAAAGAEIRPSGTHVDADMPAVQFRVLSYNIQGLPAPLKTHKAPLFHRIAEILRERRASGTQPDIVLLQEAFDHGADTIAEATGYRYILKGPGVKDRSERGSAHWVLAARKGYASFSDPQKLAGSGLYILSDFPIIDAQHKAFDSDMCAGFDCLSNKSILMARVLVPGVEEPIDIINSHFNSRGSAHAPSIVTLAAHQKQTDLLSWFLGKASIRNPVIVAGDFNTRQAARYDYFRSTLPLIDAAESCLEDTAYCTVAEGTDTSKILYDTNDKHFFRASRHYRIDPVMIVRNFAEQLDGRPLSDHLGYEVQYRITRQDTRMPGRTWALRE